MTICKLLLFQESGFTMFSLPVFERTDVENDELDNCLLFVFTFEMIFKVLRAMSFFLFVCFFPEIVLNRLYFLFFFCLFPFFVASPEISLGSFKYFELNCQCLLTCLM